MYLKQLYKHHKGWFVFVVVFALGELFICFKRGVVLTPFLQYGMYSAVEKPKENYTATMILVNGQPLQASDFSGYTWDKITIPLGAFPTERGWNRQIWKANISRLLRLRDSTPYINPPLSEAGFSTWYKAYLSTAIHRPVDSLSIRYTVYPWKSH